VRDRDLDVKTVHTGYNVLAQHWTSNLEGFLGGLGNPTDSTGLN
jgi:hypothetical protein